MDMTAGHAFTEVDANGDDKCAECGLVWEAAEFMPKRMCPVVAGRRDLQATFHRARMRSGAPLRFTEIRTAQDLTAELREMIRSIVDGWYPEGRIDWPNFFDRLEDLTLADGTHPDFGEDPQSGAVLEIRKYVNAYRRLG